MTYWGKTTYAGNDPPWELRAVEGKGYCAYSTRRFEKGDLICTETPTVWAPGHHPFSPEQMAEIDRRVEALGDEERGAFFAMANVFPEAETVAAGIFMTNSFDMTDSVHGEACAMYCALARLNHSCTPNAQQTHLPETGEEVLYASCAIEAGEEINDCYIELRQTTASRRRALGEIYRFDCECHACARADPKDDANRTRAVKLDELVVSTAAEMGAELALDVALQAVRLISSSECAGWGERFIADSHMTVCQIAEALGKRELAQKHRAIALDINRVYQGSRSPLTLRLASQMINSTRLQR